MEKILQKSYFHNEKCYEELTITDNFMFAKVMSNKQICRQFLELILKVEIKYIEFPDEEKTIKRFYHSKGVRLDVYLNDANNTIYNIEMQTSNTYNLPKRSRYYQGMIDLNLLEPGDDYNRLERSYVIIICTFDLFGYGRYCYVFENRCIDCLELVLPDEAVKVFINTKGTMSDVDEDFKELMKFFNGEFATGGIAKAMQDEVDNVKKKEEWRAEYMTMLEIEREKYREGKEEGREEAILIFIKDKISDNVPRETIIEKLVSLYQLDVTLAEQYYNNCLKL